MILDVMVPGQDRLGACERLRTDPELSALVRPDVVRSGVMAGAVDHMVRPRAALRVHPTPVDPATGHDLGRSFQW